MNISSPPSARLMLMFRRAVIEGIARDQVAGEFNIQRSTLDRNIRRVERYLATQVIMLESKIVGHVHLQRLEVQWQELMQAWRQSKEEQVITKASTDKEGGKRAEVTRKSSTGDPRYLEQARRVLADMRGLLGIVKISGEAEEQWFDVTTATIEQRFEEVDRLMEENGHSQSAASNVRVDHGASNDGDTRGGCDPAERPRDAA